MAIGIKPSSPTLYFDLDIERPYNVIIREIHDQYLLHNAMVNELLNKPITEMDKLREYIMYKEREVVTKGYVHYHWAIYKTKDGYHYVHIMPNWDMVIYSLRELNTIFQDNDSIMNHTKLCLRISPKWDIKTGKVISPAPFLYEYCGNSDVAYTHCKSKWFMSYHNEQMDDWDIRGEYKNKACLEMYSTYD